MRSMIGRRQSWWTLLLLFFVAGCGGSKFGQVTGKVTLDGVPLKGITVRFEDEGGSATIARTDDSGNYELRYSLDEMGAPIGKHKVTIFTAAPVTEGTGERAPPEIVPAKYNKQSTMVHEVKRGKQVINFDLKKGP